MALTYRTHTAWSPCFRVVPSRYPPIQLFERVTSPIDLDVIFAVEGLTNTRLRDEVGDLRLVAPDDRVTGPGAGSIMAPFTHVWAPGGRFNTPEFGAYYAARSLRTAGAETRYHRARFLRATNEPPITVDMRVLRATLDAELDDLRGLGATQPTLYDPDDYSASQAFAASVRADGSWGIVYDSVRDAGGECVAALRPRAISACVQAEHLAYVWDGGSITDVYEKRALQL